jgi:hypothetical protein
VGPLKDHFLKIFSYLKSFIKSIATKKFELLLNIMMRLEQRKKKNQMKILQKILINQNNVYKLRLN